MSLLQEETRQGITKKLNDIYKQKSLHEQAKLKTDCDWIFDDIKELISEAISKGVSISKIIEVIKTSGRYSLTDDKGNEKPLNLTSAKLVKWLKVNNIKRKVRRKRKSVKKIKDQK